jgi:hypothetical protein
MLRLLAVVVAALAIAPVAAAWTWPVDGPVLRRFSLGDDPYAGGQHRGVDVGADVGAPVRAPAAGTISFAGGVPGGGLAVTIRTPDGYSVTLLQLGAVSVERGEVVVEGAQVGTVGASADAVTPEPHVHLGVRAADQPEGYVDPLSLLPLRSEPAPAPSSVDPPVSAEPPAVAPAARFRGEAGAARIGSSARASGWRCGAPAGITRVTAGASRDGARTDGRAGDAAGGSPCRGRQVAHAAACARRGASGSGAGSGARRRRGEGSQDARPYNPEP